MDVAIVERMEGALTALSATKIELSRAVGRSQQAVSGWFEPRRKQRSTLGLIADGLNTLAAERGVARRWTVAELLGQEPEQPASGSSYAPGQTADNALAQAVLPSPTLGRPIHPAIVTAPVYGEVPCGEPVRLEGDPEMIDLFDVQLPVGWTSRCILLRARGDSMAAWGIHDGDWLGVDPQAVWWIVNAPVYTGLVGSAQRIARGEDPHTLPQAVNVERLIPWDEWQAAQRATRSSRRVATRARGVQYPLSGHLSCGACGSPLYATSHYAGWERRVYRCRTSLHGSQECRQPGVVSHRILDAVEPLVAARLSPSAIAQHRRAASRADRRRRDRISALDRQIARLTSAYQHPDARMTPAEYADLTGPLRAERAALDAEPPPSPGLPPGSDMTAVTTALQSYDLRAWHVVMTHVVDQITITDKAVTSVSWH